MIRRFTVFFLLLLLIFFASVWSTGKASFSSDILQETAYVLDTPVDTPDPYLAPTPYEGPGTSSPTAATPLPTNAATRLTPQTPTSTRRPGDTALPTPTRNLTITATTTSGPSPTAGRDLFGTENAEISNSRVTPPPSDTPEASRTATYTASPTAAPVPPEGFLFNPFWFLGGLGASLLAFMGARLVIRARHSGEFK